MRDGDGRLGSRDVHLGGTVDPAGIVVVVVGVRNLLNVAVAGIVVMGPIVLLLLLLLLDVEDVHRW